ncbi:Phosphoribosyl-ATP pyrophosphatase [Roseomonas mucosa]|uniref:Phosphoribosyl-ATP pyrophosphatase n=1 Tax=Roseomonas mucosa TaxID=207340 RepID=A0A4Y1N388_9PROT|nr:phosphoribosyl-ATP diphosphatase [Roseomonas mucosa]AWV24480.1 Phosphoribosyl-ATP pyrophosphatase [Roseomonas mucosa]MDT8276286.1 phosphoribosyl-ATP diphosphatase [Roseomonas mucosa]MDT8353991.1 phosphoribosyl-ATP diphosphatase [Roseomonas mucosa]MDU7523553.1 phosphoribosyl-ATP diphosphatase [Roseomonas mucosa]
MAKDSKSAREDLAKGKKKRIAIPAAKGKPKPAAKGKKKAPALPLPETLPAVPLPPAKRARAAEKKHLQPLDVPARGDVTILERLWQTVEQRRVSGDVTASHSARLMARGTAKVAQKLGEEAVECVIEATLGNRHATVLESADVLYHLIVVWVDAGIRPEEVWGELTRREGISGIAEKAARPKGVLRAARTTKLP